MFEVESSTRVERSLGNSARRAGRRTCGTNVGTVAGGLPAWIRRTAC